MKNKYIFSQPTTKKISEKNDIVYIFADVFNVLFDLLEYNWNV